MARALLLLTSTLLASTALAQSVILPSAAATTQPRPLAWNSTMFHASPTPPSDSRCQLIFDVSDIPVAGATWASMQVRRSVGIMVPNPAMTTTATIVMSVSPRSSFAATGDFRSNHGSSQVTVFQSQLSLPAAAAQSNWPAPWQPPIPFSQPFAYAATNGGSLVIDVMQTGNTASSPWYLEEIRTDFGARTDNPGAPWTCLFSTGTSARVSGYSDPYVGGAWFVGYMGLAPNAPGLGALGFQGAGGLWGGVLPLPYDLTALGAPGCTWNIDPAAFAPLNSDATGVARWPTIAVPPVPSLANATFYDHAIFLDPPANALGWVTAFSSKWVIGSAVKPPCTTVDATGTGASSATGSPWYWQAASVKLN